jgi:hypothetical protein
VRSPGRWSQALWAGVAVQGGAQGILSRAETRATCKSVHTQVKLVNSIEHSTRRQHETRCCAMGERYGDGSKRRAIENRIQSQFDGGDVNHTLDRIWQGFDVDFALVQDLLHVLIDHVRRHARWQRAGARGPRASNSNDQPCWCARGGGTAGLWPPGPIHHVFPRVFLINNQNAS